MLQIINQDQHPDYPQKFKDAVRSLFPILCFTPIETEAFLQACAPQFDGQSCVVKDEQGRLTFCRYTSDNPGAIYLDYIIPSVWEVRYPLVKAAILALKQHFFGTNAARVLRMQVNEKLPSHNAYYLGLLAELGFTLTPRVTMRAAPDVVAQLALPSLPPQVSEIAYQAEQVEAVIDVFTSAYSGKNEHELSADAWAQLRAEEAPYLRRVYQGEETQRTWTGLMCEGKLIGCAFGGSEDARMRLDEVVVVPEFQGQGLGRYLTLRCLQKVAARYGGPEKYFFLGTDRRWHPALKLYHRLGFIIDQIESYAVLTNNPLDT